MNIQDLFEENKNNNSSPDVATSDRMERILTQLRVRNPGARNDLEALLYDFDRSQKKDRNDIRRLSQENETAEETIERIQKELDQLKAQRGMNESSEVRDKPKNVAIEINGKVWKVIPGESDFSPIAMNNAERIANRIKQNAKEKSKPVPRVKIYLTSIKPTN